LRFDWSHADAAEPLADMSQRFDSVAEIWMRSRIRLRRARRNSRPAWDICVRFAATSIGRVCSISADGLSGSRSRALENLRR
jgi:hypothetical protein